MLIKAADEKTSQIELLERMLKSARPQTAAKIEEALRNLRAGIKGESEAAYHIEFALKDSQNWAILHDLRLESGGRVAQIDHLLISRSMFFYVIETKHFHAGVKITEEGEFLRWNNYRKAYEGMASPLAQNERHLAVLRQIFDEIKVPTRMGVRLIPKFFTYVAVSPNARIDRPKNFDTQQVVKVDSLVETMRAQSDKSIGLKEALTSPFRVIDQGTLVSLARQILARHTPIVPDWEARFGIEPVHEPSQMTTPPPLEAAPAQAEQIAAGPSCKACGANQGRIEYGKYGYYFICAACNTNTNAKVSCDQPAHKARLRKEGPRFFRECEACNLSELYFVNPWVEP